MKNIEIVSKVVSREGEALVSPSKGVSMGNLSDYLLKSIWDKVFELRTDSQGTEYIFGKLPMVTQYGITMYSGDGVDVPSLASGLPFDGRTIWYNPDTQQIEVIGGTGGGSGEGVSNFWDLSGIPSWITNSKPKYTYSEIEGTPDLTQYALVSQIPSLSGYATESWVLQKNYAIKATTLSGYGITDAYTKTNVDDLLKSYVTLGGTPQTITGEKNFTGGLKVNGSHIYYDTEKKYWKLEGDLLVTGGVTMYGSDSSFTPSTIMDAIAVDGTTISKDGGVLKVIGGTGGGVADSVAWANITGKPTWIGSSKPTYSYSEITGAISTTELQNYLTSNSYLNVTSGDNRYLKLSGGTLSGNLTIQNTSVDIITIHRASNSGSPSIKFTNKSDGTLGYMGVSDSSRGLQPFFMDKGSSIFKIWHEGNDGSGSGLDADLLDGFHRKNWDGIPSVLSNGVMDIGKYIDFHNAADDALDYATRLECSGAHGNWVYLPSKTGTLALTIDTVASANSVMINYTQSDVDYEVLLTNPKDSWVSGIDALYHSQSKPLTYNASTGLLKVGGDILATGGITMYSMRKLKNVVDERGLSLNELSTIKPTRYTWKDGRDNRLHFGGIADDIKQVLPEVVYSTSDGILTMDYGNAAFAVASSLIKPVVDHEKRIAMLEEENKQLRQEVERLKAS